MTRGLCVSEQHEEVEAGVKLTKMDVKPSSSQVIVQHNDAQSP